MKTEDQLQILDLFKRCNTVSEGKAFKFISNDFPTEDGGFTTTHYLIIGDAAAFVITFEERQLLEEYFNGKKLKVRRKRK